MKRIITIASVAMLVLASQGLHARQYGRQVGTGISFGYVHSTYRTIDWATDQVTDKNGLNGLYVGATQDITLVRHALYFQTGLYYTYLNKGSNESAAGLSILGDRTEHYLDIPLRVKYVYPLSHDLKVFAYGGPTLVAGLSSKLTCRTRIDSETTAAVSYDYNTGRIHSKNLPDAVSVWFADRLPDSRYNRLDVMMGGAVGMELFDILELHLGYDWGLVNRNRGEVAYDFKTRRHQLYFSLGLRF